MPNKDILNQAGGNFDDDNISKESLKRVGIPSEQSLFANKSSSSSGFFDPSANSGDAPYKAEGAESIMAPKFPDFAGGRSYAITSLISSNTTGGYGYADPNTFVDSPGTKPWYDGNSDASSKNARKPTTSAIINWATDKETDKNKRPYKYTDFVFCKHWNKIPNNYMMTLRRYPYPVHDNLQFPGESGNGDKGSQEMYSPITQAITYMGEDTGNAVSAILNYTASLPYEDKESELHTIDQQQPGAEDGPAPGLAKVLGVLSGGADFNSISKDGQNLDPYNNGPYMNKVWGPMNVITSTKLRKRGLQFDQKFSLNFHYVARPIGDANTKAVMLDIMANLLVLCYAEGSFWGGDYRFIAGKPAYPYIGGKAGQDSLYSGDISGFIDAMTVQLSQAASTVSSIFNGILDDPVEGLKSLAAGGAKLGIAKMLAKKKMQLMQLPALLQGGPVGEWHLTVGNPFNPMMEIGNLVCTGLQIEFGEEIGPDDFPLEMKATVSLEHGMPRDRSSIESMFNRGGGKIYQIPDEYQFGGADGVVDPDAGKSAQQIQNTGGNRKNNVNRKTILEGNPKEADKAASSSKKGGKHLYEVVKMGYGRAVNTINNKTDDPLG